MKNLTPELIAAAKAAKSPEELFELAKVNGVEITDTEAKTYFEQLHTNAAVSDDELEAVAGGGVICDFFEKLLHSGNTNNEKSSCPNCVDTADKAKFDKSITTLPYTSITPVPNDSNDPNNTKYL